MPCLVAGPPCAGKTTYVRSHADTNDRIVDFDDIVEGLTGVRYGPHSPETIQEARRLWVQALPDADWVIWTAPRRADRGRFRSQHTAEVVVVVAPLETCLRRAAENRPPSWPALIYEWFRAWEPSRSGAETIVAGG